MTIYDWIPVLLIIFAVFALAWFSLARRAGNEVDKWRDE